MTKEQASYENYLEALQDEDLVALVLGE